MIIHQQLFSRKYLPKVLKNLYPLALSVLYLNISDYSTFKKIFKKKVTSVAQNQLQIFSFNTKLSMKIMTIQEAFSHENLPTGGLSKAIHLMNFGCFPKNEQRLDGLVAQPTELPSPKSCLFEQLLSNKPAADQCLHPFTSRWHEFSISILLEQQKSTVYGQIGQYKNKFDD